VIRGERAGEDRLVVVFAVLLATTVPVLVATTATLPVGVTAATTEAATPATGATAGNLQAPASLDSDAHQREPPGENNSSVAHRNPSEVSADESLADVEVWVSREMVGQLSESANLSRADRERARELVGNDSEYAELADEYAAVANRSAAENGSERAAEFAAAGRLQREFFADVERYHRVHAAYRDASAANDSERSLRLAHELERRAAAVNRTAAELNETYANISAAESDLRNATRSIGELRGNVTRIQQRVRDKRLVRTELSVRATENAGSFTDPVPLAGQLRTADGDPVGNENVSLRVGNRTLNVTTDGEGRFVVAYRPTLAPVGDRERAVAFRPGNESAYLWATAKSQFGVRQTTPNVTISNRTETVGYNETLAVGGRVGAAGVGVPDVRVAVSVEGVRIGNVRTEADGSFDVSGRLPANVSNGSQSVRVAVVPENGTGTALGSVPFEGASNFDSALATSQGGQEAEGDTASNATPARDVAIAPANATAEFTVETTPTALTVGDVRTFNGTGFVTGRLVAEGGDPVPNRSVELSVDGRSVGTATTNATGGFATTVGLPSGLLGGDSTVRVVAAYSSDGNLAPSQVARTVTVESTGGAIADRRVRFGAAGLLVVAALGGLLWRYRSKGGSPGGYDSGGEKAAGSESGDVVSAGGGAGTGGRSAAVLLDSATTALDDGAFDAAVAAAYGAVRRELGRNSETTPRTHWEFYADCKERGIPEDGRRLLERLTTTYERAAFADDAVSETDAREAVADAEALRDAVGADPGPVERKRLDEDTLGSETLSDGGSEPEETARESGQSDRDSEDGGE
jgi:hypothetical protein